MSDTTKEGFEERVSDASEIIIRANERERKRLIELVKHLIRFRIEQSDQDRHKQSASKLSSLIFEGKVPRDPFDLIFADDYRDKLQEKYEEILPDIQRMPTGQLFQMITRLKERDQLLIDILKSVPRISLSSRYIVDGPK